MDISYLLWLQSLRQALGPAVESFFVWVSNFVVSPASMLIPILIYWCLDKDMGLLVLANFTTGQFTNNMIKVTACVYRPWIRDARVFPSTRAKPGATGYSFPSGHTQTASSVYGVIGWLERKNHVWITVILWLFTLLVAFSRNFLGVHTPQDVLTALLETVLVYILTTHFIAWLHKHPEKDIHIFIGGLCIAILSIVYYLCKSYPMDYVNGQLLVDPKEMQVDAFGGTGLFLGMLAGWFLEHRYVRFSNGESIKEKLMHFLLGVLTVGAVYVLIHFTMKQIPDDRIEKLLEYFLLMFTAVYLSPLCMKKFDERRKA